MNLKARVSKLETKGEAAAAMRWHVAGAAFSPDEREALIAAVKARPDWADGDGIIIRQIVEPERID